MLVDRRDRLGVINPTGPIHCNSRGGYLNFQNLTNRVWLPVRGQKSRAGADALGSLPLGKTGNKPATE